MRLIPSAICLSIAWLMLLAPPAAADRYSDCFNESGKPDAREKACSKLIKRGKKEKASIRAKAHLTRGKIYLVWADEAWEDAEYDEAAAEDALDLEDDAVKEFSAAIRLDPGLDEAHLERGKLGTFKDGKRDEEATLRDLDRGLRGRPDDRDGLLARAKSYRALERFDQAIADLDRIIELNATDDEAFKARGITYSKMGNHDRAIADMTRRIELRNEKSGFSDRANVYAAAGQYSQAIADYSRAIERADYSSLYASRGEMYEKLGDPDKARADYQTALKKYSSNEKAKAGLERLGKAVPAQPADSGPTRADMTACQQGEPELAVIACTLIIEKRRVAGELIGNEALARTFAHRAGALTRQGKTDDAIADYGRALVVSPDNSVFHFNRGNRYLEKKEYDRAITDYSRAIELEPANPLAYFNRGVAQANLDQPRPALADFRKALELDPSDDDARKAIAEAEQAIARQAEAAAQPPAPRGNAQYANVTKLCLEGAADESIAACSIIIRTRRLNGNPIGTEDLARAHYNRANAFTRRQDYADALKDYDEALRLWPQFANAYFNRALTHENMGDKTRAIADYGEALSHNPADRDARNALTRLGAAPAPQMPPAPAPAPEAAASSSAAEPGSTVDFELWVSCVAEENKDACRRGILALDEAIARDSEDAAKYADRADMYEALGECAKAIEDLDRAVGLKPANPDHYLQRASCHEELGNKDEAVADLRKVLQLSQDDDNRRMAGEALQRLGAAP